MLLSSSMSSQEIMPSIAFSVSDMLKNASAALSVSKLPEILLQSVVQQNMPALSNWNT